MALRIVRKVGEGILITCGSESVLVTVEKSTGAKCVLDCTGPRSMRIQRIDKGTRNDYGSTERSAEARPGQQ
jgi:hypothetical protein